MRVFLAATEADLRQLRDAGRVASTLGGFAALDALVDRLGLGGEELDLALTTAAAEGSRDAALATGVTHGRRLVVVAELATADVHVESQPNGEVSVPGGLGTSHVQAILADAVPLDLVSVAEEGLAWFAAQEIGLLL